jgi:hypothetical protein
MTRGEDRQSCLLGRREEGERGRDRQDCLSSTFLQVGDDALANDRAEIFFFRTLLCLALGALFGLFGRALALLLLSLTLDE